MQAEDAAEVEVTLLLVDQFRALDAVDRSIADRPIGHVEGLPAAQGFAIEDALEAILGMDVRWKRSEQAEYKERSRQLEGQHDVRFRRQVRFGGIDAGTSSLPVSSDDRPLRFDWRQEKHGWVPSVPRLVKRTGRAATCDG